MSFLAVYEIDKLEMRYILSHYSCKDIYSVYVNNWQYDFEIALEDYFGNIIACYVADYNCLGKDSKGNLRYQLFCYHLEVINSLTCSKGESIDGAKQSEALTADKRCQVCRRARRIEFDKSQIQFDEE